MARQFLSGINTVGIPTLSFRLENLPSAPGSPFGGGHIYYDSALGAVQFYDGSVWRNPRSRSDHTGTQTANTISDFNPAVRTNRLDQLAAPGANVPMAGFTLTGLSTTPSAAGQAAEYSWVIGQVQAAAAGIASKPPVRLVASSNQTLSGLTAIDGVTPVAGDRILLAGQSTATQNGVYNAAAGAWVRTTIDGSAPGEIEPGAMWLATEGTSGAGTQWRVATTGSIVIGTTALSIVQFGAGQTYTAGNGVTLTGSAFSVNAAAGGGISVAPGGISVDTTVVARKFATTIGDGTSAALTVTHNLGTKNITYTIRNAATDVFVDVDVAAPTVNTATFTWAAAPASNSFVVTITG